MRTFLFVCLFAALLSSCSMAHFDRYPGVKQESVPEQLQGLYYLKLKPKSHDPDDSISVHITAKGWKYSEGKKGETFLLSDRLVCSKVDDYYVVSVKDEHLKQYWNSWVVVPKNKKMELYPIVSINQPSADKLANYLEKNVSDKKENGDTVYFYKMDDASFIKYFEKEIKGRKTFEIIRINEHKK